MILNSNYLVISIKALKGMLYRIALLTFLCLAEAAYAYDYSPSNCVYTVTFPDTPSLNQMHADGTGDYISANLEREDYFLRAECIPIESHQRRDASQLLEAAKQYVNFNGLQRASYETSSETIGEILKIRGYKPVEGVMTTFAVIMVSGESSYISLYAGARSTLYPTKEISDFLGSLKLK